MASSSLFLLIDDIATLLDDVSVMTKVAAKKTAGVLGDDLALNAQQVTGVKADRELPVVWAVAKGSLLNKAILVPAALLLGYFAPFLVTPLLMVGGAYLCFEGFEKVAHTVVKNRRKDEAHREALIEAVTNENVDMVAFEKDKVKGAVRTDFVLSAEIIAITLGVLQANQAPFLNQVLVLTAVAVLITVFVYGLVAVIVKLDDVGFYLRGKTTQFAQKMGAFLLWVTPHLMRTLSVVGTLAMFTVGGSIIVHGLPFMHHFREALGGLAGFVFDGVFGLLVGAAVLLLLLSVKKIAPKSKAGA